MKDFDFYKNKCTSQSGYSYFYVATNVGESTMQNCIVAEFRKRFSKMSLQEKESLSDLIKHAFFQIDIPE